MLLRTWALLASWRLSLHDKSRRTIDLYRSDVRRFGGWLGGRDLLEASRRDVEQWIRGKFLQ